MAGGKPSNISWLLTTQCSVFRTVNQPSPYSLGMTQWASKWLQNGWKTTKGKPVTNAADLQELAQEADGLDIEWVKFTHGSVMAMTMRSRPLKWQCCAGFFSSKFACCRYSGPKAETLRDLPTKEPATYEIGGRNTRTHFFFSSAAPQADFSCFTTWVCS